MNTYDTLSQALSDLKKRGYTEDFNLQTHCIECSGREFPPGDFTVVEMYRFEGMSNPDDNSILFAIESSDGTKGTLLDAYGVYAENLSQEMKLSFDLKK